MRRALHAVVLLGATASIALAGCGDKPARRPVQTSPAAAQAAKAAQAAAAAEATSEPEAKEEAEPEYVYSPIGKRDPFRSALIVTTGPEGPGPDSGKTKLGELQRWDMEQLTVRAIVSATSQPMAMLVDPRGKGHVARRGTLIGKNWGQVSGIRRDCIVVTEKMRDATGAVITVRQEKCLPKTDRELVLEQQID